MSRIYCQDLAALSHLHVADYHDGDIAWVESLEDEFVLHRVNGIVPVDGITVIAPMAGSPAAGFPQASWYRKMLQSQKWRWQVYWGLDPLRGNDESSGTVASPLRTFSELQRRVGGTLPLGPDVLPNGLDVQVLSDVTETVILDMQSPNGIATVYFHASLPDPIYSGIIGSFTDYDSATGQDGVVHDAGLPADYSAVIGRYARVTSGPRIGVEFFIASDLTGKNLRVCEPIGAPFSVSFAALQAGDPYSVYGDLIKLGASPDQPMSFEMHGGPGAQVAFQWLELGAPGIHRVEHKGGAMFASGCVVNGLDIDGGPADNASLYNCSIRSGLRVNAGYASLSGGMSDGNQARSNATINAQRSIVQGGSWLVDKMGTINSIEWIAAFDNTVGLSVGACGLCDLSNGPLFGSGISLIGASVAAAGSVVVASTASLDKLVAPATQCSIGGDAVAYAALPHVSANTAKIVLG